MNSPVDEIEPEGIRSYEVPTAFDCFKRVSTGILREKHKPSDVPNCADPEIVKRACAYMDAEAKELSSRLRNANDVSNIEIPVCEHFAPLIKEMLQLPGIKRALATAHPFYLALLKYPEIDVLFGIRVLDEDYIRENWDEEAYNDWNWKLRFPVPVPQAKKKRKLALDIDKQYPPLSAQMLDERIDGFHKLFKFIFPQYAVKDLTEDKWTGVMTYKELIAFVKSICVHYTWNRDSRVGVMYLRCNRKKSNYIAQTKTIKIGCTSRVYIKTMADGTFNIDYHWKHTHSFFDPDQWLDPNIRFPMSQLVYPSYDEMVDYMDLLFEDEKTLATKFGKDKADVMTLLRDHLEELSKMYVDTQRRLSELENYNPKPYTAEVLRTMNIAKGTDKEYLAALRKLNHEWKARHSK